ncbi:MAG: hypothetical protein IKL16_07205 [Clostridia bacterium]|nr:hypothetical protein [Clostridia bacterium]
MKFIKRVISTVLVFMIMLSVCSSGFTSVVTVAASGGLKDIVLEPVKRPEVDFYCTEITRVAKAVDSVEPGDTIVKATPSGVPELTGSYVELAYAGETPVKTTVTFVAPVGVQVKGISCDNETVVLSDVMYSNSKYIVTVESGTATKNEDGAYNPLVFTVDYTGDDGNAYQQKCVSHVESIATGGSFAGAYNEIFSNAGWGSIYRVHATAFTRLLGKGVYYEQPEKIETSAEDPYKAYGVYNAATDTFIENSSAGYNTFIMTDDKNSKPAGTRDQTVDFFAAGTTTAHVYLDSSVITTLADTNIRLNADTGALADRNNSDPYTTLADAWVFAGSVTEQPEAFENDVTAQSAIGLHIPDKLDYGVTQHSEDTPMETILPKVAQHSNIFTASLGGNVANLADGSSYTVITKYYSYMWVNDGPVKKFNITSSMTVPTSMTFHIVDKGGLREKMDFVMNSDPEDPLLYNATGKGANPQAWYYNSGFVAFQKAYTEALAVLNNPKVPQPEIDEKTKNLHEAYDDLVVKGADYKEVNELTKIADNILKNSAYYSDAHISLIIEAKSMVKKNYSIFYQSAVDTMAYNLRFAIDRAKPLAANYDEIENLENEFNAIYQPDYNSDSIQAVKDAFAKVDYSLTALEQKQVDAWEEEIRTAMNNLVPLLADFSELVETLNEAKKIEGKYYINASILDEPVGKAEEAVADNKSNQWFLSRQEEVDTLTENLREAIDGLILKSLNKLELKAAIDAEIPGELQHYDQKVLGEYQALVEDGTEMYNDSGLTIYDQDKVDAMTNAIAMKYAELMSMYFPPLVNLSELSEAIVSAGEIDRNACCNDDAMAELEAAVAEGRVICEENLIENEENILRVAEATERINNAINSINFHIEKEISIENSKVPACTEKGSYDRVVYCDLCDEELSRNSVTVAALGHAPADEVKEKEIPATPDEEGSYEAVIYCSRCGEELSREFVIVPALGHTPAEAVKENIIEATCTEKGSYELVVYCSCCAEKVELSRETVEAPATGHTHGEVKEENKVDTTCTSNGSYDAVIYCTACNEELMRETITVPTLGHRNDVAKEENRVEATCITPGSYDIVVRCRICGEVLNSETFEIPVIPHSYDAVVTAPTCTDEGYTTYTCSVCGDSYEDDYVDATGHSYGDWVVVDATCTEKGLKTKTCACGDFVSEVISAKGHTEGEWKVTKEAGVGVAGEETLFCAVCDAVLDTKEIPAISAYFIAEEGTTTIIDDETGFIYGLEQGISDLEDFVEYEGGTVEYVKTAEGFGTGTVVNFIVNGEVLYTYTIVILGDITGDGVVDTFDSTKLAEVVNGDIELEDGSAEAFAADIENNDEVADTYDLTTLYAVVNGDIELSQVK